MASVKIFSTGILSVAYSQTVDWKVFGAITVAEHSSSCFYDVLGIQQISDKHIQIWTKCLSKDALEKVDGTRGKGKQAAELAAQDISTGYAPPLIKVLPPETYEQIVDYVFQEQLADQDIVLPDTKVLYEIDCANRKLREIAIHVISSGKDVESDTPLPWKFVQPETNGARLQTLACP